MFCNLGDYDFTWTSDYLTKTEANKLARQMMKRGYIVWMRRVTGVSRNRSEYLVYGRHEYM